jgi:hypothetical protein
MSKRPRPEADVDVDDSEESDVGNAHIFDYNSNSEHVSFQPFDKAARVDRVRREKRGSWLSMARLLKIPSTGGGGGGGGYGISRLASWMAHAVLDVGHPDPDAPGPNARWTDAVGGPGTPWETRAPQQVLDLLRFCILDEEPRLTGMVWMVMKRRAGSWTAASELIRSNGVFVRLLFDEKDEQLVKSVAFLALTSRRPRLLSAVLESYKQHVHDHREMNGVGDKVVAQNLICIALAIMDCVYAPDYSVGYDESHKAFVERSHRDTKTADTVLCMSAWSKAVETIVALCGNDLPLMVLTASPDNKIKSVSVLSLAMRFAELYPELLDHVLAARTWPASALEVALQKAVSPEGVRGPNFTRVIANLYAALLHEWKSSATKRERLVVIDQDELAHTWRNLLVTASGYDAVETGSGGNALVPMSPFLVKVATTTPTVMPTKMTDHACMRHPEEWQGVFDAMIECHDPQSKRARQWQSDGWCWEPSHWDKSSPLFESLIRQAIRKLMDQPKKTKLLLHLIRVLDEGRTKVDDEGCAKGASPPSWLSINGIFHEIAIHHPLALNLVLKHASVNQAGVENARVDENGTKHHQARKEHHEALKGALFLCTAKRIRPSVGMIINALGGHLNCMVTYTEDEEEVSIAFLPYYIKHMGGGATEEERKLHGEDYGDFVNARVEKDFKALLKTTDWPPGSLEQALQFASFYQRPICAAQLMAAPYCLKAGDDPYLLAISAWMHEPGNFGAKQAQEEFEAQREAETSAQA